MIGAEAFFVDGERAAHEGLGLGEPVGVFQKQRQIVEVDGDVRVIGAEAFFVDGERAALKRLGLGVLGTS